MLVTKDEIFANKDRFTHWNFEVPEGLLSATGYEGVAELEKYSSAFFREQADDEMKQRIIKETADIYERMGIYPIRYFSHNGILSEIRKAIAHEPEFKGDVVSAGASVGTTLCNFMFPNLHKTPSGHDIDADAPMGQTAWDKFYSREWLERIISYGYHYDTLSDSYYPSKNLTGGIRMTGSVPTNFRPMNARAIFERFTDDGDRVWDYACVDDETEFFNGIEWKSIADYVEGDKVLQYNEDGTAELVDPIEYIKYESDEPFYLYEGKMFNSALTGDHRIVYRKRGRDKGAGLSEEMYEVYQKDVINADFTGRIPLAFNYSGDSEINENLLRLLIAIQADGTIDNFTTGRVRFSFTKERKIARLKELLKNAGVPIRNEKDIEAGGKSGKYINFHLPNVSDFFDKDKNFPVEWVNLTNELKEVFLEELLHWDGSISATAGVTRKDGYTRKTDTEVYHTTNKHNTEVVQFIAASQGIGTSIHEDNRYDNPQYTVIFKSRGDYSAYRAHANNHQELIKKDKYCFTVPSGMLVLRRKKQIFITGNCGFGGRMLGALSSGKDLTYIGTDPNSETMYNLHRLGKYIEMETGRQNSYELFCQGSEEYEGDKRSINFAFASPPYFSLEMYGVDGGDFNNAEQCWQKFPELEEWLEGYVRPTIKNLYRVLKRFSAYAVNIADFKIGNTQVNYVDEWKRISIEEGFTFEKNLYLGARARTGSALLSASVPGMGDLGSMKTENIMVFSK